jgi:undecaprenyl diphosphate synthase
LNLQQKIEAAVELTRANTGMTLCFALDYGSRDEITEAVRHLIADGVSASDLNEALLTKYLFTHEIPDPDLVIRTGDERRLSNFLLWQAAYSELYFTSVLWPDFGQKEIEEALLDFKQRQRRFGRL